MCFSLFQICKTIYVSLLIFCSNKYDQSYMLENTRPRCWLAAGPCCRPRIRHICYTAPILSELTVSGVISTSIKTIHSSQRFSSRFISPISLTRIVLWFLDNFKKCHTLGAFPQSDLLKNSPR